MRLIYSRCIDYSPFSAANANDALSTYKVEETTTPGGISSFKFTKY